MDILKKIRSLDLFSGIGGITLGLQHWTKPVAYCEIDPYCQSVLLSRMQDGTLPKAPIWSDIRTLPYREIPGDIDLIAGGFPCQDISCAGVGKGLDGERSGLFFEIARLAKEIKPKFLFLENVPAITTRGGLRVVECLTEMGYDCRWCVISAASVGALHRRERWFLLAYSHDNGALASKNGSSFGKRLIQGEEPQKQKKGFGEAKRASGTPFYVANCTRNSGNSNSLASSETNTQAQPEQNKWDAWGRPARQYWPFESREHWQETVCSMDKCSDGVPHHSHRLKALGNAVVPAQVTEAFQLLIGIKK